MISETNKYNSVCTSVTTLNTKQSVSSFINLNISCKIRQKQTEQIILINTILEIGYEFLFEHIC